MPSGGEAGQVGGLEALAFGMLVLVVGILLVSNAWGAMDAATATRMAAREGARAYARAAVSTTGDATTLADAAARDTLGQMGWAGPGAITHAVGAGFARCRLVTYVVSVRVPVFRLPWLGRGPSGLRVTARHTERVDPFRSGVPGGAARCGP